jgi:D-amino peptidase
MQGLEKSFAGAIIMGHAKAGTQAGVLNHTYVMRDLVDVRLNGETIGELGLNMLWAAYLGVPVILVIGDDKAAQEALKVNPEIETAVVKYGLSQFTAHHLPLERANQLIRDTTQRSVRRAAQGAIPPVRLPDNFEMEIDFSLSEIAHLCSFIPSIERVSGRTVRFSSQDYREVQHLRIICSNLALATIHSHY